MECLRATPKAIEELLLAGGGHKLSPLPTCPFHVSCSLVQSAPGPHSLPHSPASQDARHYPGYHPCVTSTKMEGECCVEHFEHQGIHCQICMILQSANFVPRRFYEV